MLFLLTFIAAVFLCAFSLKEKISGTQNSVSFQIEFLKAK